MAFNPATLMKLMGAKNKFTKNHPKFESFVKAVFLGHGSIPEGTIIEISVTRPGEEPITTNIIANILGLGWAATPAGLKAMEELSKLEEQRRKHLAPGISRPAGTASNEMCTFLIINISSLQLIPINVIAYRSQYGSVNPASIIGAGIVSTLISTAIAVIYCKLKERSRFQN